MFSRFATASAVVRLSPVSITIRIRSSCSCRMASAVVLLDRIRDADQSNDLAIDCDEHHRLAFAPWFVGRLREDRRG